MTHSVTWDTNFEASPTDANYGYEIDDKIRELKSAIRERLETDLVWKTSTTTDGLIKAHRSRVKVQNTSGQSIPVSTYTKLTFATELYDNLDEFGSNKFTASVAGYYRVTYTGRIGIASGYNAIVQFYKNGVDLGGYGYYPIWGGGTGIVASGINFSFDIYLEAGDYLEIYLYQNDTVARTVYSTFDIHRFA